MKQGLFSFQDINWRRILGELFMLVTGILIALQINNWNEDRKERNFERKILAEIALALKSDLRNQIETRIYRAEQIEQATATVLEYLDGKIAYHDSLARKFWRLNWVMLYEPQTAPFETLRSKGIETVRNDKLRQQLLQLYDYSYPNIQFFINDHYHWTNNRIKPYCLKNFRIEERKRGKAYVPVNPESLRKDTEFRNLALEKNAIIRDRLYRLQQLEKEVRVLLAALQKHSH